MDVRSKILVIWNDFVLKNDVVCPKIKKLRM